MPSTSSSSAATPMLVVQNQGDEEQQALLSLRQQEEEYKKTFDTRRNVIVRECEEEEEEDDYDAASKAANALLARQLSVSRRMAVLTFFAAIGGFLSGYNTGVIAGALLPLKRAFDLTALQEEMIVSATIVSACFASSIAMGGTLNTYYGRRGTLLLAAAIFTVGGALLFVAQSYTTLLVGEILLGLGIGLESLTSPLYIAEVAKPSSRGRLVSAYALMMCMGQFVAGIMDGVFGALLPDEWAWRCMFGTAMVPGTIMFIGFLGLPESPSWLMMQPQHQQQQPQWDSSVSSDSSFSSCGDPEEQAYKILQSVRDTDQEVELELQSLRLTARDHNPNSSSNSNNKQSSSMVYSLQQMFCDTATRNALFVGCGLMILQQICGVNGVLYYAASVYEMAGFAELTSIWLSAFTAFAQIIGLALAVVLIETAGRRVLVLYSLVGIGVASLGLGYSFYAARIYSDPVDAMFVDPACAQQAALVWDGITRNCWDCTSIPGCGFCGNACVRGTESGPLFMTDHESGMACPADSVAEWSYSVCENNYGYLSVVFMVLYLIVFGMGMAGLPWTVNSEIYPVRFRSLAVSISTGTNWLSNLLVSSTFLTLNRPGALTSYGSFYLYATLCFMGAAVMYCYLPETKGLSMHEIEQAFRNLTMTSSDSDAMQHGEQQPLLLQSRPSINLEDGTFHTVTASTTETSPTSASLIYPAKSETACGGDTVRTCDSSAASYNEPREDDSVES